MLTIRLQRVGRKHEPKFRLVLTDSKNGPKSGKYVEVLGSYDSRIDNKVEQFNVEKIKSRIKEGAKLSGTVHNFLVSRKVIAGKKINVLPKKTAIAKPAAEAKGDNSAPAAAAPAPTPAA